MNGGKGWSGLLARGRRSGAVADVDAVCDLELGGRVSDALARDEPFVLLDDQAADCSIWFEGLQRTLVAHSVDEVRSVVRAAEEAAKQGFEVAGFLSYRAGEAFDALQACARPLRPGLSMPLAWFGLFERTVSGRLGARGLSRGGCFSSEATVTAREYRKRVKRALDHITAGDVYQVNVTYPSLVRLDDPLAYYASARARSQAPFGAVLGTGDRQVLSFSPELFFRVSGRSVETRPMKGTHVRDDCPECDRAGAAALAGSAKDRAENLMIVDLLRNDLARICEAGSVKVPALYRIEPYPTVWQMTSSVTGILQPERGVSDVIGALFPCGSIVGAPKIMASRIIDRLEAHDRGLYTGAIGWIRKDAAQFNVAIRTMQLAKDGDGYSGRMDVGAGIVADSVPQAEWDECVAKAAFAHEPDLSAGAGSQAFEAGPLRNRKVKP